MAKPATKPEARPVPKFVAAVSEPVPNTEDPEAAADAVAKVQILHLGIHLGSHFLHCCGTFNL